MLLPHALHRLIVRTVAPQVVNQRGGEECITFPISEIRRLRIEKDEASYAASVQDSSSVPAFIRRMMLSACAGSDGPKIGRGFD